MAGMTQKRALKADRGEWGIMLRMYITCISTSFDETPTMYPKSKQVEDYMGSDTENVISTLFNTKFSMHPRNIK